MTFCFIWKIHFFIKINNFTKKFCSSISAVFFSLSFHVKTVVDSSSAKLTKRKPKPSLFTASCKEKDAKVTSYPQAENLLQKYMA